MARTHKFGMSASPRKRPKYCVAAKCRDVPNADIALTYTSESDKL
jgi:hypothetical protein